MPVPPPLSVTQQTAPAPNAGTQADAPAWHQALADAQTAPRQNSAGDASSVHPAPARPHAKKADGQNKTPPPASDKAAGQAGKPKDEKPGTQIIPVANPKEDKKDDHQPTPALPMAVQAQPALEKPADSKPATPAASDKITGDTRISSNEPKPAPPVAVSTGADNAAPHDAAKTMPPATADNDSAAPAPDAHKSEPAPRKDAVSGTTLPPATEMADPRRAAPAVSGATPVSTQPATGGNAQSATGMKQNAAQRREPAPPQTAPRQLVTPSTAQAVAARTAQPSEINIISTGSKEKDSANATPAINTVGASTANAPVTTTNGPAIVTDTGAATASANTGTTPAALAATVTALHQSGQASTVLRLDPPGLGHLSVQLGLSAQGQVNVLFMPSNADAAQALQSSLPGLGAAMAQSGLTLGQAQVGGQFSQQGGQGGHQPPPRQNNGTAFTAEAPATTSGLSAYA